jgi:NAD(P)H-dependent FMN reductase
MPASLKNAIDLLKDEWVGKPISLCTVSSGPFGGVQALLSIQNTLWKIGANISSSVFTVPEVAKAYNEKGEALNKELSDKLSKIFLNDHLKLL